MHVTRASALKDFPETNKVVGCIYKEIPYETCVICNDLGMKFCPRMNADRARQGAVFQILPFNEEDKRLGLSLMNIFVLYWVEGGASASA